MIGTTTKASIIAPVIILALVFAPLCIASFVLNMLNLPSFLSLPLMLRATGIVLLVVGVTLTLWLFRYRRPETMIVSTYFTFRKLFTRAPIEKLSGRSESLVIDGPQKYLRHPLYFGAIIVFFGWGLLTSSSTYLIATVLVLLWFRLVQIPFEEKEMIALFGDEYRKYMDETPMMLPFSKHYRPSK